MKLKYFKKDLVKSIIKIKVKNYVKVFDAFVRKSVFDKGFLEKFLIWG
jgi:hypothetical protein